MASRELYSSMAKRTKKPTFGQFAGDYGRLYGDNLLSLVGAGDVIDDDDYKTDVGKKASQIMNPIYQTMGTVAATALGGPMAGSAMGALQQGVGNGVSSLNNNQVGPSNFRFGGPKLTKFEGNTHENGGIPLAGDEVENGETMMPMGNQEDFIFSNQLFVHKPNKKGVLKPTKQTFADRSKRIESKYKLRPNDPYGNKSKELQLKALATEQESLKQLLNPVPQGNEMAMGGKRYWDGGLKGLYPEYLNPQAPTTTPMSELYAGMIPGRLPNTGNSQTPVPLLEEGYVDDIPSNILNSAFQIGAKINPSAGKFKTESLGLVQKSGTDIPQQGDQSNFLPTALGYAAQAATNIPAMFMKPETKNFSRVKFGKMNLAEQRNEARRTRNLGLATARGIGAQSGDVGQTMNYLSGTTAGLNSAYGNQFNQSLLQEKEANLQSNMREQLANSEIERYEEQINTQEADAIRNLKMQALMNMGTSAAMAGKDYLGMQEQDAMIDAMDTGNFTYDSKGNRRRKKLGTDGSWDGKSYWSFGGKRRRVK